MALRSARRSSARNQAAGSTRPQQNSVSSKHIRSNRTGKGHGPIPIGGLLGFASTFTGLKSKALDKLWWAPVGSRTCYTYVK